MQREERVIRLQEVDKLQAAKEQSSLNVKDNGYFAKHFDVTSLGIQLIVLVCQIHDSPEVGYLLDRVYFLGALELQ